MVNVQVFQDNVIAATLKSNSEKNEKVESGNNRENGGVDIWLISVDLKFDP